MMILVYHLLVLAVLLSLLGMVVMNMFALPRVLRHRLSSIEVAPSVSILLPARNEEANIEACLRSLLAQDYPDYQVWVYDDASTDNTRDIAARMAAESSKLHVVPGVVEPPDGWLG